MGPSAMIHAYKTLDLITTNLCTCNKITMFHKIGLCSIISYCNLNKQQQKTIIAIDFTALQWKIIERLIKNKTWPTYQEIYDSYEQVLTLLENKLTDIFGNNNYIVYAFIDGYAKNKIKYLTRYNRSYETTISVDTTFPILSPGTYLWNIVQKCYSSLQNKTHITLIQSDGESDGYMINYLKQFTNNYIIICSIDNDIPLLSLQLSNCNAVISLTSNKQYNIINIPTFKSIILTKFKLIEDFLFTFYLFVKNDFHNGINMYNDPITFFDKVMPCVNNLSNISEPNNLYKFILNIISTYTEQNNINKIHKNTSSMHDLHRFFKVSYCIMNNYYIDTYKLDKNTSCYYNSLFPVDIISFSNYLKNILDSNDAIIPENYQYKIKHDFIETLAFLPQMDYDNFQKTMFRMFPINNSNIQDIKTLWNIFYNIKSSNKNNNYYTDIYGNHISSITKKICLPHNFDKIYEQFFHYNNEIQNIYNNFIMSQGITPKCTNSIDICRDYFRTGYCNYTNCKYRHINNPYRNIII